jgi:hypothetical protein
MLLVFKIITSYSVMMSIHHYPSNLTQQRLCSLGMPHVDVEQLLHAS